ncbi:hypothetical protein ACFY41_04085 [Streptomyces syringium]|uniref:hypothetical protein n=1 Tax=Streptomyces syringium TaxID=76729 RepID=UPI0036968F03
MLHWWITQIEEDSVRDHCARLAAPQSTNDLVEAFLALLHSDHTAAIGVALDYYHSYESMYRHGIENPFEPYDTEVLDRARRLLQQTPTIASHQPEAKEDGANHASALAAMMNLAENSDADLIASVLRRATTSEVKRGAALAAAGILEDADTPPLQLVDSLRSLVLNDHNSYYERSAAISALSESDSDAAYSVILQVTRLSAIELQAQAAIALVERDFSGYREEIERAIAHWPQDVGYPATKLLAILSDKANDYGKQN